MKTIILCGGLGTRISEETIKKPKPMVKVGKIPILEHILNIYIKHGYDEFILATGYKNRIIENYFKSKKINAKIKCINTGKKTLTGGRIKRLKKYINKNENFMVTYGDGLSNVNLKKLYNFHLKNKKLVTVTAVRPPARFGHLKIKKNLVSYFKEKSHTDEGWINGGFFVINSKFLDYIKNDESILEKEPLERACKKKNLVAYKHHGFWQCVDTKRDLDRLKKILK